MWIWLKGLFGLFLCLGLTLIYYVSVLGGEVIDPGRVKSLILHVVLQYGYSISTLISHMHSTLSKKYVHV
jgi:hypothetical protein